uniref:Uncharacterized protein n=1 Tax=Heterorhabditis bacteriophora TaxID=37862 RepID=A0A1I7WA23_HETBA
MSNKLIMKILKSLCDLSAILLRNLIYNIRQQYFVVFDFKGSRAELRNCVSYVQGTPSWRRFKDLFYYKCISYNILIICAQLLPCYHHQLKISISSREFSSFYFISYIFFLLYAINFQLYYQCHSHALFLEQSYSSSFLYTDIFFFLLFFFCTYKRSHKTQRPFHVLHMRGLLSTAVCVLMPIS